MSTAELPLGTHGAQAGRRRLAWNAEAGRYLGRVALLSLAYYAGARIGLAAGVSPGNASAVWPPSGIAVAALLLCGPSLWPGVALGAAWSSLASGIGGAALVLTALGPAAQALAVAWCLRRWLRAGGAFNRVRSALGFCAVSSLAPALCSTLGGLALVLEGYAPAAAFWTNWRTSWLGDTVGILMVTPLVLAWRHERGQRRRSGWWIEFGGLLALLLPFCYVAAAASSEGRFGSQLLHGVPVFLMWAAFRFGQREVMIVVHAAAAAATFESAWVFPSVDSAAFQNALISLQSFVGILAATGLGLSAAVAERREAEARLGAERDTLDSRVRERTLALAALNEALRTSRQMLTLVLDTIPQRVFWKHRDGFYLGCNRAAAALAGLPAPEAIVGKTDDQLVWRGAAGRPETSDAQVMEADTPQLNREEAIPQPDGATLWVRTSRAPLHDAAGKVIGLLSTIEDITEFQRAQEALAARARELARSNADLEQFAYVASHDLQEPLRAVAAYTQLLAKRYQGKLDADADRFIAHAVDGAHRMQTLIRDLLAYSRVGARGCQFQPTDAGAALDRALAALPLALHESGAEVTRDALPSVLADSAQLSQLFQNLAGNAVKFRADQPPRVHVSACRDGPAWRFSVRDNGIGIDPRHAERIFVIFQRLHTRRAYPGTGIGLAICKKIVERHGGRIWVESQPGHGADFRFTIPDRVPPGGHAAPPDERG